ncbi:MAG: hypothetical protein ABIE47_14350 [Pseudomonadota bacterium]
MGGQEIVFKRENPIVQTNSCWTHGYCTETKKGAVEKPDDDNQPDKSGRHMFRLSFYKGEDKKKHHRTQRKKHDAVLHKERFYDEGLGCHGFDSGLPYSLLQCQFVAQVTNLLLDRVRAILLDSGLILYLLKTYNFDRWANFKGELLL